MSQENVDVVPATTRRRRGPLQPTGKILGSGGAGIGRHLARIIRRRREPRVRDAGTRQRARLVGRHAARGLVDGGPALWPLAVDRRLATRRQLLRRYELAVDVEPDELAGRCDQRGNTPLWAIALFVHRAAPARATVAQRSASRTSPSAPGLTTSTYKSSATNPPAPAC
jgi:hypothetical protein